MEEFLHRQLHVSKEALELAQAMVSGETVVASPLSLPPPPPAKVVYSRYASPEERAGIQQKIRSQQEKLSIRAHDLLGRLAGGQSDGGRAPGSSRGGGQQELTREQSERGKRGEEEIKRRLQFPGGWESFTLIADKRDAGCGYDFLCTLGDREIKLEVKTFNNDGRVVFTSRELQEAAASKEGYCLIGVLDDGRPINEWDAFKMYNPIDNLLTKGDFDIETSCRFPRLSSSS